jgi:hypothetical protein
MPPLTWDQTGDQIVWDSPIGLTWDGEAPNTINNMPSDNLISITFAPADKTAILTKLNEIRTILQAYAVNLTPLERRETPTIGTERGAMVLTFDAQMQAHPEMVPAFVDMAEKNKDSASWHDTADMWRPAKEITEILADILHLVGADLMTAYLAFYGSVKGASRHNVAGSSTVYDDLRRFFPRGVGSGGGSPVPPPAP